MTTTKPRSMRQKIADLKDDVHRAEEESDRNHRLYFDASKAAQEAVAAFQNAQREVIALTDSNAALMEDAAIARGQTQILKSLLERVLDNTTKGD